MKLLVLAVAHHQTILPVPQHEGLGNGFHRVAQPRILVGRADRDGVVGDNGDAGQIGLAVVLAARDLAAQP